MEGKEVLGVTEPVDEYVWNMVMDNGYDCVFGIDIDSHDIWFYHVYERKNPGSVHAKIDTIGAPGYFRYLYGLPL